MSTKSTQKVMVLQIVAKSVEMLIMRWNFMKAFVKKLVKYNLLNQWNVIITSGNQIIS